MTFVANAIKTTTGVVTIDATPPEAGQVLTAITPVTARWEHPYSGAGVSFPGSYLSNGKLFMSHSTDTTFSLVNGTLSMTYSLPTATANSTLEFTWQ